MKILILSHAQYITVGLQKIIEFAESLARLRHEVTLGVTSKTKRFGVSEQIINNIKIVEFPSLLFGNLRHGIDIFDIINRIYSLKNRTFDVVHCVASRPTVFYPAIFLKKKQKLILIYEWEDSFANGGVALEREGAIYYRLFGWIEKYFEETIVRYADGVVVVSDYLKNRTLRLGIKPGNIRKQIKGTQFIEQVFPNKEEAKEKILTTVEKKGIIFTYVGSIYESDLRLLLRTFEKVCMVHPEVRLRLIGYNRKPFKTLPDRVSVLHRVPTKDYILNLAATDIFLLPFKCSVANISRYPSKFGDYLAVGRPVIATPLPEIKKIIETGDCGYVAIDDTPEKLSETIIKALEDQEHWPVLGERARSYALNCLSWNNISKNVVSFYKHISETVDS